MENEKKGGRCRKGFLKRLYGVKPGTFKNAVGSAKSIRCFATKRRQTAKTDSQRQSVYYPEISAGVPDHGQYRGGIRHL
jgi:hypothetical protein